MRKHLQRLTAAGLIAGHGVIHVALPFVDIIIHVAAAAIFLWSFRHAVPTR